jgi:very-short-patch-repair endonuclease
MNSLRLKGKSKLEREFEMRWASLEYDELSTEYCFHPKRKWRFDFASVSAKVAIELEGGLWTMGRHVRPTGYIADCEKYNAATLDGWAVLRLTQKQMTWTFLIEIHQFILRRQFRASNPIAGQT